MIGREDNQAKRLEAINLLFTQIHNKHPSIDFDELDTEKKRLLKMLNAKYGAELFDQKLLNLKELLEVETIRGVQFYLEKTAAIIKYYERNHEKINWNIENKEQVRLRLTTGRMDNWDTLTAHDINLTNLNNSASTVFILDVLTRMPCQYFNTAENNIENSLLDKQRKLYGDDKKMLTNELMDLERMILAPMLEKQLIAEQEVAEEQKEEVLENIKNEYQKEKAEELLLIREKDAKEAELNTPVLEKLDAPADDNDALEQEKKEEYITQELLAEKKRMEEERAYRIQAEYQTRVFTVAKTIYSALQNYTLWAEQVTQDGNSPEINWVLNNLGHPVKVPTGIFKQLNIIRANPIDFTRTLDTRLLEHVKLILEDLATEASFRLEHKGIFSTRKSKTRNFYQAIKAVSAALNNDDINDALTKLGRITGDIIPYMPIEETHTKTFAM